MNYIAELEREKAHSDGMTAAAAMWMHRAQSAERQLFECQAMLVHAAGGTIEVPRETVLILPDLELIRDELPERFSMRFRVRRKSDAAAPCSAFDTGSGTR